MSEQQRELLSENYKGFQPSSTLQITNEAKSRKAAGEPIIILAAGEPDIFPPEHITSLAAKAATDPKLQCSRYTAAGGIQDLRKKIAAQKSKEVGGEISAKNVMITAGLKPAISLGIRAVVNPGEEVIIPKPFWVSYQSLVEEAYGTPVFIDTSAETNYKISPEQLERACSPKTKAFMLCSPANPTGAMYSGEEMAAFAEVLRKQSEAILTIHDSIYGYLAFPGENHSWFAKLAPDLATLTVDGFSKSYSLPGWRIGYAVGPEFLISKMIAAQSHLLGNPPSLCQQAVLNAFEDELAFPKMLAERYAENAKIAYKWAQDNPHIKACSSPQGAFYIWLELERDGDELAKELLDKAKVALIPGSGFGYPNALRLSYPVDKDTLLEALDRLDKALG